MSTRVSSILVALLGCAIVALAVFTVIKTNDLSSQVSDLEDSMASIERLTASGGKDMASEIKRLSAALKRLHDCIPEIQSEIDGLSIESIDDWPYIETNSQISSYCQEIVYPTAGETYG